MEPVPDRCKTPPGVEFRDALLRTPIGKILRRELRDNSRSDGG